MTDITDTSWSVKFNRGNRVMVSALMAVAMLTALIIAPPDSAYAAELKTIETVSMPSTSMQLFDYWTTAEDAPDNTPPTTCNAWKSALTSGINGPASLNSGGVQGEALKFAKDLKWPPSGCNLTNWGSNATNLSAGNSVKQGMVQPALQDDFPALNGFGNGSLAYLFNPAVEHEGRANYEVAGANLFKMDGNYLKYNSQENFASYNKQTGQFDVYNKPAVQTGSNVGQFFPFNTADQVFSNGEANAISATDPKINHFFGLGMLSTFTQPLGGVVGSDDMVFDFSGDDDMWIFIDGALILDLGGSHAPASGSINFRTGQVTVKGNSGQVITSTTLQQQYSAAGLTPPSGWQGSTFVDGTRHRFSLFYLERGNYQSNLEITTNLNYMPAAHIQKTDIAGNNVQTPAGQSAEFDLYNTAADYDVAGAEATKVGSFSTDEDGAITFVDEQTGAQMNFGRFPTPYFVLKETKSPPGYALLLNAIKLEFIPVSQVDGTVIPGTGTLNVVNYYETGVETSFDSWATPVNSSIYRWCPGESDSPGYNENTSGQCPEGTKTVFDLNDVRQAVTDGGGLKAVVVHAPGDHDVDFPDADTQVTNPDASGSWQHTGYHLMNGSSTTGWRKIMPETDIAAGQYMAVTTDSAGVLKNSDISSAKVYDFDPYGSTFRVGATDLPGMITDYNIPNRTELNFDVLYYLDTGNGGEKILLDYNSFSRQRVSDIIIPNTPELIRVRKVDADGNPLRNVGFTIFTDKQCAEATQAGTCSAAQTLTSEKFTDENGYVTFTAADVLNLYSYGQYYLKESTPPVEGFQSNPNAVTLTYSPGGYFADAGTSDLSANNPSAGEAYTARSYDPDNVVSVELELNRIKAPIVGRGQNDPVTGIDRLANLSNVTGKLFTLGLGQVAPSTSSFDRAQWLDSGTALALTYDYGQDACARVESGVTTNLPCTGPQDHSATWVTQAEGKYRNVQAGESTHVTVDSGYASFAMFPTDNSSAPEAWDSASQGAWQDNEITFGFSIQKTIVVKNLPERSTLSVEKWAKQLLETSYHKAGGYTFALYRKADPTTALGDVHDGSDILIGSCTSADVTGICSLDVTDFGDFFWEETGVPAGEQLPERRTSAIMHINASNAGTSPSPMQFYNPRNPGQIRFLKYAQDPDDSQNTSLVLAGAVFEVWSDAGSVSKGQLKGSCTTGADGSCSVEDLAPGDYVYRECKAPSGFGYVVVENGCSALSGITVQTPSQPDSIVVSGAEVSNTALPTPLTVAKVSLDDLQVVDGATYGLYRMAGNNPDASDAEVGRCATGGILKNCTVNAPTLGRYYWKEITAPSGYDLNPCPFPNSTGFYVDCLSGFSPIAITTGNVGQATQFAVTIANDWQTWTTLSIRKTALVGGAPLEGAKFALYRMDSDPSGTVAPETPDPADARIDDYTTDASGRCDVAQLPWGKYYWVEEIAPEGYELPHRVTSELIVIDSGNAGTTAWTNQEYTFNNPRNPGKIVISKFRSTSDGVLTSTALADATFMVYEDTDSSGDFDNAHDKQVGGCTTSDVHTPDPDGFGSCSVQDLNTSTANNRVNSYFVVETDAPQEYQLPANPVSTVITLSGDPGDAAASYQYHVGNVPQKSKVLVRKIDATEGTALAGAVFELYEASGVSDNTPVGGPVDSCTTSGDQPGTEFYGACAVELEDFGNYVWKEIAAPQGYALPDNPLSEVVSITQGGSVSSAVTMSDEQKLTDLKLKKYASDSSTPLEDAAFALYRAANTGQQPGDQHAAEDLKVGQCSSDASGECEVSQLPFGTYFWEEVGAPSGYALPKDRTTALITVDASNAGTQLPTVAFHDPVASGSITVRKFARGDDGDSDTSKPLGGAVFVLHADSNNSSEYEAAVDVELNDCRTASSSGECSFERLAPGAYFVEERTAPLGYELPARSVSPVIILSDEGYDAQGNPEVTEFVYTVADRAKPSSLTVRKIDAETTSPLYGAKFELYRDTSGTGVYDPSTVSLVNACVTTAAETGSCTVTGLELSIYFWKEVQAPVGYELPSQVLSDPIRITVPDTHNETAPTIFEDEAKQTALRLLKVDMSQAPLAGAQFDLYRAADPTVTPGDTHQSGDDKVASCTSDGSGICEVTGLAFGSYYWEEMVAPPAHTLPTDRTSALVHITPENAGTAIPALRFANPRNPGKITVVKTASDDVSRRLGGARYVLFVDDHTPGVLTPEDSRMGECTTSYADGSCTFEDLVVASGGQRYYLREVSAPLGYTLSDEVYELTLSDTVTSLTRTVSDTPKRSRLSVLKVDADDYTPLSGARFTLFRDNNGNGVVDDTDAAVNSCATEVIPANPDGRCSVEVDGFGRFLWVESVAPPGYELRQGVVGTVYVEPFNAGDGLDLLIPTVVSDRKSTTSLKVRKSDAQTGEALAGAVFDLTLDSNGDGEVDDGDAYINSCTSGLDGMCTVFVDDFARYLFTERSAPKGYQHDAQWVGAVNVTAENAGTAVASLALANQQIHSTLTVHKADAYNPERALSGAGFALFRYDGDALSLPVDRALEAASVRIGRCDSDASGGCSIGDVVFGTYFWKEIEAPRGYLLPENLYSQVIVIDSSNAGSTNLHRALFLDVPIPETPSPDNPMPNDPDNPPGTRANPPHGGRIASTGAPIRPFLFALALFCVLALASRSFARRS
ncbi:MAG: hypothetical protein LKI30_03220 [Bifidobacterium crudilactis]|jgi:fibro-slime domain-containing protein|nr:hypothetical protein [Bifidobacterium crudilactis]